MPTQDHVYWDSVSFKFLKYVDNSYITIGAVNDLVDSVRDTNGLFSLHFRDSFDVSVDAHSPIVSLGNLDSDNNNITWTLTLKNSSLPAISGAKFTASKIVPGGPGIFTISPSLDLTDSETVRLTSQTPDLYEIEGKISSSTSNVPRISGIDSYDFNSFTALLEWDPYQINVVDANFEEGLSLLALGAPDVKFKKSSKFIVDTQAQDFLFDSLGNNLYVAANSATIKTVNQYPISSFAVENASASTASIGSVSLSPTLGYFDGKSTNSSYISGIEINDSENKLLIGDRGHNRIYQYDMDSPGMVSSAKFVTDYIEDIKITETTPYRSTNMRNFTLSIGPYYWRFPYYRIPSWSSSTPVWDRTFDTYISKDGKHYYTMDAEKISQWTLSKANDISSAVYVRDMPILTTSSYWDNTTVNTFYRYWVQKAGIQDIHTTSRRTHVISKSGTWNGNPTDITERAGYPHVVKTGQHPLYWYIVYYVQSTKFIHTTFPQCFTMSDDGTKLFITWGIAYSRGYITTYDLTIPFDISTASELETVEHAIGSKTSSAYDVTQPKIEGVQSIQFNSSGDKVTLWDNNTQRAYQYNVPTAYTLSSISMPDNFLDTVLDPVESISPIISMTPIAKYFRFNNNGTKFYVSNDLTMKQYSMSTAYDLGTAVFDTEYASLNTNSYGNFNLNDSENKIFSAEEYKITQYSLTASSSANNDSADLSSRYLSVNTIKFKDLDSAVPSNSLTDVILNSQGTKMYVSENNNDNIHLYLLSDSNIVSSAVYESTFTATSSASLQGIYLTPTEDKILGIDLAGFIREYDIHESYFAQTSWNTNEFKVTGNFVSDTTDIKFHPDGSKFVTLGKSGGDYSFDLYTTKNNFIIKPI